MNEPTLKCPSEYRLLEAKRRRHCPYPFSPNPHVLYQTTLNETKWGTENEMTRRLVLDSDFIFFSGFLLIEVFKVQWTCSKVILYQLLTV